MTDTAAGDGTQTGGRTGILAGRIALVTGASRGIGRAVAVAFAREGAHVVALARTVGALEDLDDEIKAQAAETGGAASLVPHDLTDGDGLDRLGASLYERFGRLDVLVGNAGVLGPLSPVGHVDPKRWAETLDINLTANYRLIRSMDPLLRLSDAGRAIFVTTGRVRRPKAFWAPYAASKAGLEALVKTYAEESKNTPVRVNLLDPDVVRTAMRQRAAPGEDPATLPPPEALAPLFVALAAPGETRHGETLVFHGENR